jgi:capsular exopolysaccharide synthesis family protein
MTFKREIRAILLPLWRWLPLLVGLVVLAVLVTRTMVGYMTPIYRASGTIQIDNRDFGVDNFQLSTNQSTTTTKPAAIGLTEMEVLRSRMVVGKAIDLLDWKATFYRIGDVKSAELYQETPFFLKITAGDSSALLDRSFWLTYLSEGVFGITFSKEKLVSEGSILRFDKPFNLGKTTFILSKNNPFLRVKPNALRIGDRFEIIWRSREKAIDEVLEHALFIKPLDKEAMLLKVVYDHPIAQKSSDFVGALLRSYIEQSKESKARLATDMLAFLDSQLVSVTGQLRHSESGLAAYRAKSGISAVEMEMDMAFKERMQHNLREVNYELQEAELARVFDFLVAGHSLEGFSPNFEALNDGIFKETYLRAQLLELQKQELLAKFTPQSEEFLMVQGKINQLRGILNESVGSAMANIKEKKKQLRHAVADINSNLHGLPEKQRHDAALGRDVKTNEELYTHLLERRTALALAAASGGTFHRIIDLPEVPNEPFSPNLPLYSGLAVLLALLFGMLLAWLLERRMAMARTVADLEHLDFWPTLGQVFSVKNAQNAPPIMDDLLVDLDILTKKIATETHQNCPVILLASAQPSDGKSFLTTHLGIAFAGAGRRVLLVDGDLRKGDLAKQLKIANFGGLSELIQRQLTPYEAILPTVHENLFLISAGRFHPSGTSLALSASFEKILTELRPHFDLILVDSPALVILPDALPLMQQANLTLFLARAGKTPLRLIRKVAANLQNPDLPPAFFVLTDVAVNSEKQRKRRKLYADALQNA